MERCPAAPWWRAGPTGEIWHRLRAIGPNVGVDAGPGSDVLLARAIVYRERRGNCRHLGGLGTVLGLESAPAQISTVDVNAQFHTVAVGGAGYLHRARQTLTITRLDQLGEPLLEKRRAGRAIRPTPSEARA